MQTLDTHKIKMQSQEENVTFLQLTHPKFEDVQKQIFNVEALQLLREAVEIFHRGIDALYTDRLRNKILYENHNILPKFTTPTQFDDWKIASLPPRLRCRHVELGDVSPANTAHFVDALNCDVQSIQVDFDDGHCPTWKNQIQGYVNVIQAVNGKLHGAPCNISACPILMLRPRAWNIIEHNMMVNGKEVPGALIDFIILMYHCGKRLSETGNGPFFYLSKVESGSEAKLWNDIFIWTQNKLSIPYGTIKACVLIENVFSIFEAEQILYALKDHSLGLNCGIWDYVASILVKFGDRSSFILPDRLKYVNIDTPFIKSYFLAVIRTCHRRGAPATGGMVGLTIKPGCSSDCEDCSDIISKVIDAKQKEIVCGVDGFLVYDMRLIPSLNKLWKKQCGLMPNQLNIIPKEIATVNDILEFPMDGMYYNGLQHNVAVTILFIFHWLGGVGHFFFKGNVEDSATAEISRTQVWQCIRHKVFLIDEKKYVTYALVEKLAQEFTVTAHKTLCRSNAEKKRFSAAKYIALELFVSFRPPDFITTYLNDSHKFRTIHNKALLTFIKSSL